MFKYPIYLSIKNYTPNIIYSIIFTIIISLSSDKFSEINLLIYSSIIKSKYYIFNTIQSYFKS